MLKFEESAKYAQEKLADAGYYSGMLDGLFGDVSKGALQRVLTDAMSYKGIKPSAPSRNLTT
ncbi:hypothetical protein VJI76_08380, partial [Parvimonas sp. M13]|nr:hypothetical protein [Parvimonas sp. M13]